MQTVYTMLFYGCYRCYINENVIKRLTAKKKKKKGNIQDDTIPCRVEEN